MGIIYCYTNKKTQRKYIGQTKKDLSIRRKEHLKQFTQDDFHKDLNLYGEELFEIVVLEDNVINEKLNETEGYWINYYNNNGILYNINSPTNYKLDKPLQNKKIVTETIILKELPKDAVLIKGSENNWIDTQGNVYTISYNKNAKFKNKIVKRALNDLYGYKTCHITYPDGQKIKRVHRLVAEAFIPNPNNYPIVGHKNNIKTDNRVENLYWTTISENTQKAVNDYLLVNDKERDDSQSIPVIMYDTLTNKKLGDYGSISEASKITGISKATIGRQARYKRPTRKPFYFRFENDIDCKVFVLAEIDYDTEKIIKTFVNSAQASKETERSEKTINYQIKNGKPKHKFSQTYFKYIDVNKCEETIEN